MNRPEVCTPEWDYLKAALQLADLEDYPRPTQFGPPVESAAVAYKDSQNALAGAELEWPVRLEADGTWPGHLPFPFERDRHGDVRFRYSTTPYHGAIRELWGIAIEKTEHATLVHGWRKLSNPRESGYQIEGRVSVAGKRRRAFTSDLLLCVNGHLCSVAKLYVCRPKSEA